jgi:hypothetical protein
MDDHSGRTRLPFAAAQSAVCGGGRNHQRSDSELRCGSIGRELDGIEDIEVTQTGFILDRP